MDENAQNTFIQELDREISWQWKWERLNRILNTITVLVNHFSTFLILVLSFYQLRLGMNFQRWVIFLIAVLSVIAIALTLLSNAMRFQQKQQVYDQMARAYSFIRIQLITKQIPLDKAISAFGEIHIRPTEKVIREMP